MFDVFNASDLHVSCGFLRLVIVGFGCDTVEALVEIIVLSKRFWSCLNVVLFMACIFLFIAGLKFSSELHMMHAM